MKPMSERLINNLTMTWVNSQATRQIAIRIYVSTAPPFAAQTALED